ncbi:HAMP domain-containing sensor histidine kinase [Lactobacillus sp. ESL0791]|uniref:sensor histidine kinase n=1 Tax=Lactobacillus sp. ESL0791 TaxID=2983234 RepID=UPI0023F9600C|nr:HAMP domain-containing sensor histidine kinase [Lactobacillus sp. ESL0791]MDF7639115.1 HAMP domain-containing sensor histidine kinase [Lactobacillus sp. ESL0791]
MKLLYQHLLSFLFLIIISVSIIGYSEINYITEQVYAQNYKKMEDYASSVGKIALTEDRTGALVFNSAFLDQLQFVLHSDDLHIRMFDSQNEQIYPKAGPDLRLSKRVFDLVTGGREIRIKNNNQDGSSFGRTKDAYTGVLIPWTNGKKVLGVIWVGSRVKNVEQSINMAKRNLVNALVITLIIGLLLSFLLSYYSTNKIKRLSRATKKVAAGDFDVKIQSNQGKDEIDQLADNFNQMVVALKKSDTEIKTQEKRRDQFMADAAHEMRTPLTTINGILEGLQYDAIPEEAKPKSIALMRRETKRLIRLVNENLDYEKIRNNQIMLVKTVFNANNLLKDIKLQLEPNAKKANDELCFDLPDDLPIYADRDRFTQILVNLIQNAIQFTQNGEIIIKGKRGKHCTIVSVTDNGIGMSQDQVKYIFERFFKADPSRARGTGESGLGLAIVSSLVKQHGGTITVASTPGKGSTFTVTIFDQGHEQFVGGQG